MTILDELAQLARNRVEQSKKNKSLEQIKAEVSEMPVKTFEFEKL